MPVYNQTVTLNGRSDFTIFDRHYEWDDRFLQRIRAGLDDGDRANLKLNLRGEFDIEVAKFNSSPAYPLTMIDQDRAERRIDMLRLSDGDATLRLTSTEVNTVRGFGEGANHDMRFDRYVDFIQVGDAETIKLDLRGGAGAVQMHEGDTEIVVRNDFVRVINLGHGDNTIDMRANSGTIHVGNGDNTFDLSQNFDSLIFGHGRNIVEFTGEFGGAITGYGETGSVARITLGVDAHIRSIGVSGGRDSLILRQGASVEQAQLGGDNDKLTVNQDADIESANLGSGRNIAKVLGGDIQQLLAYSDNDRLIVADGRVGQAHLGSGDNKIIVRNGGEIESLVTHSGNDVVTMSGQSKVDVILAGSGNNKVTTADRFVQGVFAYDGDDQVTIGSGGAGTVKLDSGDNRVTASSFVDAIVVFDGEDRVTLTGGAGSIRTGGGSDLVTVSRNPVALIALGDGDDTLAIRPLDDRGGFLVSGWTGLDTLDLSGYRAQPVTLSLDLDGEFQDINGRENWISLTGIENVIGANGGDDLTGNGDANTVSGGRGDDTLTGLGGDDVFVIGNDGSRDRIADFVVGADVIDLGNAAAVGEISFSATADGTLARNGQAAVVVVGVSPSELNDADNFLF